MDFSNCTNFAVGGDEVTLRDRFFMAALTGLIAKSEEGFLIPNAVELAYRIADAGLAYREEK